MQISLGSHDTLLSPSTAQETGAQRGDVICPATQPQSNPDLSVGHNAHMFFFQVVLKGKGTPGHQG